MQRRHILQTAALTALAFSMSLASAQGNTFKIGLILPMTGQQASTGRQIEAAARLYMAQHGDTVAGKKIELIVKDDVATPDVTKRLAQELVVNEKVNVLAGFGVTPAALAAAPIATQSKTPLVVMAAATSSITEASHARIDEQYSLSSSSSQFFMKAEAGLPATELLAATSCAPASRCRRCRSPWATGRRRTA